MSGTGFHVINFGCRAAQSEGAAIAEELLDANAAACDSPYEAGVVIVNTCTVTAEADREARQTIHRIAQRNPGAQILVTGCYAQRAPEELAAMPGVRWVVGNSHKALAGGLAAGALLEETEIPSHHGRAEVFCSDIFLERELRPSAHFGSGGRTRATIKVQDGCNANCSFCIIPTVRGRSRSLAMADVASEAQALVERGYKEIVLSGIHLGTYGRDLAEKTSLLHLILKLLDDVPALERLRLSSIEPLEVTPDIVRLVASHPRIARHLHIPLQSGSARILRQMRRPYAPEEYAALTAGVRNTNDEVSIGADVMVGFPGETDEDFAETFRLIEQSPLTYLHVFPYSERPGTAAAAMANAVPDHVARFRARSLRQLIAGKNERFRRSLVGRTIPALVLERGEALGSNFIKVEAPADLEPNRWFDVRMIDLTADGLRGALPNGSAC
jgi:threonylcarbamoyladenosine tRNA methylthiotransferase MtaB